MPIPTSKLLIASALAAPFWSGCGTHLLDNRTAEGTIEYELTFPDQDPDDIMAGMLPERTMLTFSKDRQSTELSAGMGIFRTTLVTDDENEFIDYHLSLMSKRLVAHLLPRDLTLFNKSSGNPTILFTEDTDTIAGYPCRRALAVFDNMDEPEIELWYTDRIDLKNPNWFGPFAEVPGVLLRYEMVQYGLRMRLNAIAITPGKVDPAKFKVKEDFLPVGPEVLHQELAEVLSTFSM
ncbi:MAG TPA: hypothetical protein PK149_11770 [Flavobacteriales bacterium]|nr:hypothetical protein [Flavobacteriales bacterium]